MEPLDNPMWHALTGPQAHFAEGTGLALRFEPDVAPFGALPDTVTPDAWEALAKLVGPGEVAFIGRPPMDPPDAWEIVFELAGYQYIAPPDLGTRAEPERFVTLGPDDVDDMTKLVEATRPGPFRPRTHELGTYIGMRDHNGALVAMAGERLHPAGYSELSAVCTDPAYRGKGLATALMEVLAQRIYARDDQPILHVAANNDTAIGLYERLGFSRRATFAFRGLRAPS
jgi:ribosomal protein S18 acetylase RimI-like enzyme